MPLENGLRTDAFVKLFRIVDELCFLFFITIPFYQNQVSKTCVDPHFEEFASIGWRHFMV